jgi:hypothetical protein
MRGTRDGRRGRDHKQTRRARLPKLARLRLSRSEPRKVQNEEKHQCLRSYREGVTHRRARRHHVTNTPNKTGAQPRRPSKKRKRPFPLHLRRKDIARLVVRRHNRLPRDCALYIKAAASERIKRRKERQRLRQQARRHANGAKPREQALSRTKPWLKDGISERHWRRRRKAMSEIRAHDSFSTHEHESRTSSTARGPTRAARGTATASAPRNPTHGSRRE